MNVHVETSEEDKEVAFKRALIGEEFNVELQRMEKTSVEAILNAQNKANSVAISLDKSVQKLVQIHEWLDTYSESLKNAGRQIQQIENENNKMQFQTRNQKKLLAELETLFKTLSLDEAVIKTLLNADLSQRENLESISKAAYSLTRVLNYEKENGKYKNLSAVIEKLQYYKKIAKEFASRLKDFFLQILSSKTQEVLQDWKSAKKRDRTFNFDNIRSCLTPYRLLTQWLREMDTQCTEELLLGYVKEMSPLYEKYARNLMKICKFRVMVSLPRDPLYQGFDIFLEDPGKTSKILSSKFGNLLFRSRSSRSVSLKEDINDGLKMMPGSSGDSEEIMVPGKIFEEMLGTIFDLIVAEEDWFQVVLDLTRMSSENESLEYLSILHSLFEPFKQDLIKLSDIVAEKDVSLCIRFVAVLESYSLPVSSMRRSSVIIHEELRSYLVNLTMQYIDHRMQLLTQIELAIKKRNGIVLFMDSLLDFIKNAYSAFEKVQSSSLSQLETKISKFIAEALDAIQMSTRPASDFDEKELISINVNAIDSIHLFIRSTEKMKTMDLPIHIMTSKRFLSQLLQEYCKNMIGSEFKGLNVLFDSIERAIVKRNSNEKVIGGSLPFSHSTVQKTLSQYSEKEMQKIVYNMYRKCEKLVMSHECFHLIWYRLADELAAFLKRYQELLDSSFPDRSVRFSFNLAIIKNLFKSTLANEAQISQT